MKISVFDSIHIGFRLFARIGQAGDAPGLSAAAEKLFHGILAQMVDPAGMGHDRQGPVFQVAFPQIGNDCPVILVQWANAIYLSD